MIRWMKRFAVVAVLCLVALVVFVAFLPGMIAGSSLRHEIVASALGEEEARVEVGKAHFAWFEPVSLSQLDIANSDRTRHITIEHVQLERSLLGLWFTLPSVGAVEVDKPRTSLVLQPSDFETVSPEEENSASNDDDEHSDSEKKATFRVVVRGGELTVRTADEEEPVIDLDGLNLTVRVEQNGTGRELSMDRTTLFDHHELTPQLCDRGLQLVAPVLADAANVSGHVTVNLSQFRIPLDEETSPLTSEKTEVAGSLQLHDVHTSLKNPMLIEIANSVGQLLGREPPQVLRVLDNTRVDFQIRQGRVYHEGLAFVLPEVSDEVVIQTSGTVGFDESLDLKVHVTLPSRATAGIPLLRRLTQEPLVFSMTGTIEKPRLQLPEGRNLLDEFANRLAPAATPADGPPTGPAREPSIGSSVSNLIDNVANSKDGKIDVESTAGSVLDLIRAIREKDKKKEPAQP